MTDESVAEPVSHTPGPWHVEKCDDGYRPFNAQDFAIIAENRITPALVWGSSFSEGKANANLIAAAPDMLAALRNLVACVLDYERVNNLYANPGRKYCWDATEQADAAIAKAEGRDV